ncbi:MAG: lysylphosphatidylglycerol synthase domain-containing protein [Blastocatellia bacterium]
MIIGITLFALVLRRTGVRELAALIVGAGWGGIWILLIAGARPALRSVAWLRSMEAKDRAVGFFRVCRARLIGDAVGNLMTAGPLLAEPARLVYLSGRVPMQAAAASLSIELVIYIGSCLVVMSAGLLLLLGRVALDGQLRVVTLLALALLTAGLLITIAALLRRWSPLALIERFIAASIPRSLAASVPRHVERLREIERSIFDFHRKRPRDFLAVCLCEAGFHLAGVAEIWITLRLIGERPTTDAAFIFEAVNRLITILFAFIPARMGVDEAGTGLFAAALGFSALVGVTLAIYRKLRVIFWTAVGLGLLAVRLKRREAEG